MQQLFDLQVYDFGKLSRPSVASQRPSNLGGPNMPSLGVCRVASDPDISSAEAANIILPTIDLREILNSGNQYAAIDSIGGAALPKLDFGNLSKGLTPKGSHSNSRKNSNTSAHLSNAGSRKVSKTHLENHRASESGKRKGSQHGNQGGSRSSTKLDRLRSSRPKKASVSENRLSNGSALHFNNRISNMSRTSYASNTSFGTIESQETYDSDHNLDNTNIDKTARNVCLVIVIVSCICVCFNPWPNFVDKDSSPAEKKLWADYNFIHWFKIPAGLFLLIMISVNYHLVATTVKNTMIHLFEFDNKVDPSQRAKEFRRQRLNIRKGRESNLSITSKASNYSQAGGKKTHYNTVSHGHAQPKNQSKKKMKSRRGSAGSMVSMKHAIKDINNK